MKVLDPGHKYALRCLDGQCSVELQFVKRSGPGYPGNVGSYPGTNIQEVLRALIDRVKYLDDQIECRENSLLLRNLRDSLRLLEERAAKRHGRFVGDLLWDAHGVNDQIEFLPTCSECGHIGCEGECRL